jgi:hypothetical protein
LAGPFKVIFTGLKRVIGSPTDFNKITFDSDFLAKIETYDLSIPIAETKEGAKKGQAGESDIDLSGLDNEEGDQVGNLNTDKSQHL